MNVAFSGSAIEAWYKAVEKDIHFSQMDHLLLRIVADWLTDWERFFAY